MKKLNIALVALAGILLTACGPTTTTDSIEKPVEPSTTDSSTSEEIIDEEITLKMFGDLYMNGYRTIYATLKNNTDDEFVWESSNPKVVTVSGRTNLTSEGNMIAQGYGKATITVHLKNHPSIKKSLDIEIKKGEPLSEEVFAPITSSVKVNSDQYFYSYEEDYSRFEDEHFTIETIYEESAEYPHDPFNTTDNYQITVTNTKNNRVTYEKKYVRGASNGAVSTEYKDMFNRIVHKPVLNSENESTNWLSTLYPNRLGDKTFIAANDFETFDGGRTYHFVGLDSVSSALFASLYATTGSPDDVYFKVAGHEISELHFVFDPFNSDVNMGVKFGGEVISTFSEQGTAKIDHIPLFEHKDYHDPLIKALDKVKNGKNYTVEHILDWPGVDDDARFVTEFTENDVHQTRYADGKIIAESGIHRTSGDAYFSYTVEGAERKVVKNKEYAKGWDIYGRYPVFSFAAEIFESTDGKNFVTIENMGAFVQRSLPLTADFQVYEYPNTGTLTLDDNYDLKSISTVCNALEENVKITGNFSKIGSTVVDLDFAGSETKPDPTSWAEENPSLFASMQGWNIDDIVPFLHAKPGFADSVGYIKNSTGGVLYAYIDTDLFDVKQDQIDYINAYKAVLKDAGFVATGEKESKTGYDLYKKGSYLIGIGVEKMPTGRETTRCRIIIISQGLVNPVD